VVLDPGYYTFLWQFVSLSSEYNQNNTIKIESITIDRVNDASYECKKCEKGSQIKGSDQCIICGINFYFDESLETCVACPEYTFSDVNSVG